MRIIRSNLTKLKDLDLCVPPSWFAVRLAVLVLAALWLGSALVTINTQLLGEQRYICKRNGLRTLLLPLSPVAFPVHACNMIMVPLTTQCTATHILCLAKSQFFLGDSQRN